MNMLNIFIQPFVRIDLLQITLTQALSLGNFSLDSSIIYLSFFFLFLLNISLL